MLAIQLATQTWHFCRVCTVACDDNIVDIAGTGVLVRLCKIDVNKIEAYLANVVLAGL